MARRPGPKIAHAAEDAWSPADSIPTSLPHPTAHGQSTAGSQRPRQLGRQRSCGQRFMGVIESDGHKRCITCAERTCVIILFLLYPTFRSILCPTIFLSVVRKPMCISAMNALYWYLCATESAQKYVSHEQKVVRLVDDGNPAFSLVLDRVFVLFYCGMKLQVIIHFWTVIMSIQSRLNLNYYNR